MMFNRHTLVAFFSTFAFYSPVVTLALTSEEIAEAVGDGGKNKFTTSVSYFSEDGVACGSCVLCSESSLMSIFDTKGPSFCVDCTSVHNPCNKVKLISVFDKDWIIKYFSLTSSNDLVTADPMSVTLEGSNEHQNGDAYKVSEWSSLFYTDEDGGFSFAERGEEKEFPFHNSQKFSAYAVTFGIKANSNQLSVANYGLVQSCTSQYTSELLDKLLDIKILPYDSLAPTVGPSLYEFNTKNELQLAVNLWTSDKTSALQEYGDIQTWRVHKITSMDSLFKDKKTFNEDISQWDTSAVQQMYHMFLNAHAFNSNLSDWNVSSVKRMDNMFAYALVFNFNLSDWNISAVTEMRFMFRDIKIFDQVLCWDTSKASADNMFLNTKGGKADPNC